MSERTTVTKQEIMIHAGLCKFVFTPWVSTGTDEGINPGVGFSLIPDEGATLDEIAAGGVISLNDAVRLRNELEIFIKAHAAGARL